MNITEMCVFVRRNTELVEIFPLSYKISTFLSMSFWCNTPFSSDDTFFEGYFKNQEPTYDFKWTRTYWSCGITSRFRDLSEMAEFMHFKRWTDLEVGNTYLFRWGKHCVNISKLAASRLVHLHSSEQCSAGASTSPKGRGVCTVLTMG